LETQFRPCNLFCELCEDAPHAPWTTLDSFSQKLCLQKETKGIILKIEFTILNSEEITAHAIATSAIALSFPHSWLKK
jgi:hypothetical protein